MFKDQKYIREKQHCWHNPSNKLSRISRFGDFFFNMNQLRSKKDYTGKCAQCAETILPIILTDKIYNFLSLALFFSACYGVAFLSVCLADWLSLDVHFALIVFYCPLSWIMHRIIHSAVCGFFRWESYKEDTFNVQLQQSQAKIRINAELILWAIAYAGGGIQAATIFR